MSMASNAAVIMLEKTNPEWNLMTINKTEQKIAKKSQIEWHRQPEIRIICCMCVVVLSIIMYEVQPTYRFGNIFSFASTFLWYKQTFINSVNQNVYSTAEFSFRHVWREQNIHLNKIKMT